MSGHGRRNPAARSDSAAQAPPAHSLRLVARGLYHVGRRGCARGRGGEFPRRRSSRSSLDMYDKGFIYRGKRLVNWDPHFENRDLRSRGPRISIPRGTCGTSSTPLADARTYTYVEKDEDGNVTCSRRARLHLHRNDPPPRRLLGDGAVAVHPGESAYAPIVGLLCEIPVGPKGTSAAHPDHPPTSTLTRTFGSGAVKIHRGAMTSTTTVWPSVAAFLLPADGHAVRICATTGCPTPRRRPSRRRWPRGKRTLTRDRGRCA